MFRRSKWFVILLVVPGVLVGCGGPTSQSASSGAAQHSESQSVDTQQVVGTQSAISSSPVTLGLITALTGASAISGNQTADAVKLAVNEVNASGGILGKKVSLETQDAQCLAGPAVSATNKLIQSGVTGVIGPVCSVACLASIPLLQRAGIPGVTPICTAPNVTERLGSAGGNPWYFRINPPDSQMGAAEAKVLWDTKKYKTYAVLSRDDDFGRGVTESFTRPLKKMGAKILSVDYFKPGTTDFSTILSKIQAEKPDTIIMVGQTDDSPIILKQYRSFGMTIPISGRLEFLTKDAEDAVGGLSNINGAIEVNPWFSFADDPASKAFVKKYSDAYHETPLWQAFYAYTAAKVMMNAIAHAGTTDSSKVLAALAASKMKTAVGDLAWDNHNQNHAQVYIAEVVDGAPHILAKVAA